MKSLLLILLFPLITKAQTADEIIQKYSAAMGGLDAVNKIESVKITGTLISQGKPYPLTIQVVNGKQMRTDVTVNGQVVTNAYDKGKGWKLNPYENIMTATEVTAPDELITLKLQCFLANNLLDYKKRGHTVEYMGKEDVEGQPVYKIKLVSKDDGKTSYYYIGTNDYMLVRSDAKQKIQENEYDASTYYSDFQNLNGVEFGKHFIRKIMGTVFQEVKYDKLELNVKIDDKVFKMPQ